MARELAQFLLVVSMQKSHIHRIGITSAADANDRSVVLLPYMGKQQNHLESKKREGRLALHTATTAQSPPQPLMVQRLIRKLLRPINNSASIW
jgi:hypothetical protein